jgi:hypothetical protein
MEYATPTYGPVNKYLHSNAAALSEADAHRNSKTSIFYSGGRCNFDRAFCRCTRYLRYNCETSLITPASPNFCHQHHHPALHESITMAFIDFESNPSRLSEEPADDLPDAGSEQQNLPRC